MKRHSFYISKRSEFCNYHWTYLNMSKYFLDMSEYTKQDYIFLKMAELCLNILSKIFSLRQSFNIVKIIHWKCFSKRSIGFNYIAIFLVIHSIAKRLHYLSIPEFWILQVSKLASNLGIKAFLIVLNMIE